MTEIAGTKQREETLGLIASAWEDAAVGDTITISQPNGRGGKSLEKTIKAHFPGADTRSRNKSRIMTITKTVDTPAIITEWLKNTELRLIEETGFYSMPGLFGWNRVDTGSTLLLQNLPPLQGVGADFGCGYGYLSRNILNDNDEITTLYCLDNDNRAITACHQNINDRRARFITADCTQLIIDLLKLDFIVMNPPFHDAESQDYGIGQKFIITAAEYLKPNGCLHMVANRHLPYEKILSGHFKAYEKIADQNGFKIITAVR